ncbi:MAG: glycosyltransferase family 2 protein [Kiritimatiellae bacterium]|nr:glycosyltransferase family 2 protein [Kiritimatiellia bacterium]MDD4735253.1 glycosyltransferase family 2 protein [Kiritimatiellia bacterium]
MRPFCSIITPSRNMAGPLRCCAASVSDQAAAQHIIVDAASTEGTLEWLKNSNHSAWISEPDSGMYDALNKGFVRASGDILAWLNADEQYLPGALENVRAVFDRYPDVDIVYGDSLVVDAENQLICVRKGEPLRRIYLLNDCLHVLTCGIFFRRRLWDDGFRFNPDLRCAGENDFFLRVLKAGAKTKYLPGFLAAFTVTGSNLGVTDLARKELAELHANHPGWITIARPLITLFRRVEKIRNGAYRMPAKLFYELYARDEKTRREYTATSVTYHWPQ